MRRRCSCSPISVGEYAITDPELDEVILYWAELCWSLMLSFALFHTPKSMSKAKKTMIMRTTNTITKVAHHNSAKTIGSW